MGLFDNEDSILTSNSSPASDGFSTPITTTPATTEASPGVLTHDSFNRLNPTQQLMAVKTGLVVKPSDAAQAVSQNGVGTGPSMDKSSSSQGTAPNIASSGGAQGQAGESASEEGGSGDNKLYQGGNSKESKPYSRKLTDLEKYYLRGAGFDDSLLDEINIHAGKPHVLLIKDAVTPDASNIYMRNGVDKPDNLSDLEFLAHELHHAQQFRDGMTKTDYVSAWTKHGYEDSPYEVEARDRAALVRDRIKALRLQEIRREAGANADGTFSN